MRQLRTLLLSMTALAAAACGGTDPGIGTKTLYVRANMGSDGSTDSNIIAVEVREGSNSGNVVTDAQVVLKSSRNGDLALQLVQLGNLSQYVHTNFLWDAGFVLSVRRGNDSLDAALVVPGYTVITEPISGTTFRKADGRPLRILWRDEFGSRAQEVDVRLDKADVRQTSTTDVFFQEFQASQLVVEPKERVDVTRKNKVTLAGGVAGSEWSAQTHHRVEFHVE